MDPAEREEAARKFEKATTMEGVGLTFSTDEYLEAARCLRLETAEADGQSLSLHDRVGCKQAPERACVRCGRCLQL